MEGARSVVHSEESSSDSDSELIHVVKASDETVKENSEQEIVHLDSRLTLFQKLIVVKMFKEEKVRKIFYGVLFSLKIDEQTGEGRFLTKNLTNL